MADESGRLAEIFKREKSRFLRFVQQQFFDRNDTEAEDILSEVTYNLLRRADIIGEIENLTAYFYRSLANRVVDHHRKRIETVWLDDQEDASLALESPIERFGPEEMLEQHELRERLFNALDQLSHKEREVWLATEIDEHSFYDLSIEWDEPIGTLLSRKSRATAKLRRLLAD